MATTGGSATFKCLATNENSLSEVQWLVNGTALENLNLTNVDAQFNAGHTIGTLKFRAIPQRYNGTRIKCRAMLSSGSSTPMSSDITSKILLQGTTVRSPCMYIIMKIIGWLFHT